MQILSLSTSNGFEEKNLPTTRTREVSFRNKKIITG